MMMEMKGLALNVLRRLVDDDDAEDGWLLWW
jgi:hypothetical protein